MRHQLFTSTGTGSTPSEKVQSNNQVQGPLNYTGSSVSESLFQNTFKLPGEMLHNQWQLLFELIHLQMDHQQISETSYKGTE